LAKLVVPVRGAPDDEQCGPPVALQTRSGIEAGEQIQRGRASFMVPEPELD
jgi:hypothetical protein